MTTWVKKKCTICKEYFLIETHHLRRTKCDTCKEPKKRRRKEGG